MKQILFVHGGGEGAYEEDGKLVANLGSELGSDYKIRCPARPNGASPDYPTWKHHIKRELARMGSGAILVGHSQGASILLKARRVDRRAFVAVMPIRLKDAWAPRTGRASV